MQCGQTRHGQRLGHSLGAFCLLVVKTIQWEAAWPQPWDALTPPSECLDYSLLLLLFSTDTGKLFSPVLSLVLV